jgi:hypothetical protein
MVYRLYLSFDFVLVEDGVSEACGMGMNSAPKHAAMAEMTGLTLYCELLAWIGA